ncbi:carotenoid biosynthesis protein [Paenibacillus sp. NPDC058174]|uniref:carotenoid biosynthesis protein n=1 Tax=Paenibacillus sp. NPDC058174 TaxID=3346366 RepID=UPI0036D9140B
MIRVLFLFWYGVGLILMLTIGVPKALSFSNGMFLVLFAVYAASIEGKLGERATVRWRRIALVGLLTFGIEWAGVQTGWPFGEYAYTSVLGFKVGGVPFTIACAWVGVLLTAILLARGRSKWGRALQAGMWTVFFDLVLDPVAYARQFWIWQGEGGYYGVPASNFISWFLISASLSLFFPVRDVPVPVYREAVRLTQLMLLMFGLLGLKEGLYVPMQVALAGALVAEGVLRYDSSSKKQMV